MDVTNLKFKDCAFDMVVSFQVIEHLRGYDKHLLEVKRILKPDEIFILSTPNKLITSPNREKPIFPFHIKEFYPDELHSLLSRCFVEFRETYRIKIVRLLSSFNIVRLITRLLPLKIKDLFTRPPKMRLKPEDLEISEEYQEDGYILIAKCKK